MKTVEEIYEEMLDTYSTHTGLRPSVSCDLSVRLYAVASQIFALNAQTDWVSRQCFPQTAVGEYLEYHAQMRGIERKAAAVATGKLRFSAGGVATQDLVIPLGTVAMTAGLVRVVTVEEAVLMAGDTVVDVKAEAVESGSGGNIASGMIISMAVPPVGVSACSNPEDFVNGTDEEGDEALRERILYTYQRLPNGANGAFYLQEALSFDHVSSATVIGRARGISTVDVVIASPSGLPEAELLEEVQAHLEGIREIAVDVLVRAPSLLTMDLSVKVKATEDYTTEEAVEQARLAVEAWFDGSRLGESLLEGELGHLLYQCDGVKNYQIQTDMSQYVLEEDQLPVLGTLLVEEMP